MERPGDGPASSSPGPRLPATIGPYEVVRLLGQGGMGAVYEARRPGDPRRLAVKVITSATADVEALERFGREARALARVRHPSVVAVHDLARADGPHRTPYMVTDLVEGRSLADVAREERLDPREAARVVRDLAGAVEAVHAEGVLHRDLKPANVILRPDGRPVLLDFGLARDAQADSLTRTGEVLGTPAYMAPEQAGGEQVDARTDVYGLGALLFALLAGRPPFSGGAAQLLYAVLRKEPEWPAAPPALREALREAMAKDPARRPPSAAALADLLDRYLAGEAAPAGRGLLLAAAAGVAVVALAGGAVALSASRRSPPVAEAPPPPVAIEAPPAPPAAAEPELEPLPESSNPRAAPIALLPAPADVHSPRWDPANAWFVPRGLAAVGSAAVVCADPHVRGLRVVHLDRATETLLPFDLAPTAVAVAPDGDTVLTGGRVGDGLRRLRWSAPDAAPQRLAIPCTRAWDEHLVRALAIDAQGVVWIGLSALGQKVSRHLLRLRLTPDGAESLPPSALAGRGRVNDVLPLEDGAVLVSTRGQGAGTNSAILHLLREGEPAGGYAFLSTEAPCLTRAAGSREIAWSTEAALIYTQRVADPLGDPYPERTLHHPRGYARALAFGGEGERLLFSAGGRFNRSAPGEDLLVVWDLSGEQPREVRRLDSEWPAVELLSARRPRDDRPLLLACYADCSIAVWDARGLSEE